MDVVLGVSMTPTTARLVLVEGAGADGRIVDTDTIIVSDGEGTASDQVLSAIVGTRDGMLDGGHHLVSTGVVWSDHTEAAALRDSLASRGIDGVEFFSALHAGGALAKAASNVTGYDKSALLVIEPENATLAVVDSADGSIVGLASEPLITGVTPGVLASLVNPLKGHDNAPDGVFLLGLGTDVSDLTDPLGEAISLPVNSPDQPELALARGAALASAQEPDFEASTALLGQAYSLEGPTGTGFAHPDAVTESAGEFGDAKTELSEYEDIEDQPAERKPFLLVGAPLLLVFGICSIALAVSLTVTVRSTVDQGPSSPDRAVVQNPVQNPLPPEAPKQAPPPVAEAPAPVAPAPVQQVVAPAPQRNPAPVAAKPAPQAPAPAPEAPPPPAAPAPEEPAPVAPPPAIVPVPIPLFPPVWEQPRRQENPWWAPHVIDRPMRRRSTPRRGHRPFRHSSRPSSRFRACPPLAVGIPTAGPVAARAVAPTADPVAVVGATAAHAVAPITGPHVAAGAIRAGLAVDGATAAVLVAGGATAVAPTEVDRAADPAAAPTRVFPGSLAAINP
ncbi:hypothetical protein MSTE_04483 [Mycobacteroides stephanolepidis]|uniref:DUF7159 domain-containing protein n=1 Tax=[Mycobacterium] stephanolepidis TaxID=1520670 RepID=A0A1Z4F3L5_9MYCO|nr:hypothetical protein MSTE_04483 [[Mycobacterium] stephanolepidis]